MFLVARLIGVGSFLFFLIMVCLLVAYTNISVRALLGWYALILAVMGFFYEPHVTADLYRIREMMQTFSAMELPAFLRTYVTTSTVPVARMLYWLVGKSGEPGLLPAIACLVSYGCIFAVLTDAARRCGSRRVDAATALFFLMSVGQFMFVVSNVRTMMAVSLVCWLAYRETVEKKRHLWHLALYAVAAMIHTLGIVVIALRLLIPVVNRNIRLWKRLLLGVLFLSAFTGLLIVMPTLADELLEKVEDYIFGDRYSYFWEYLIGVIALFVQIWCLRHYRKTLLAEYGQYEKLGQMLLLCIGTACVFCFEFSLFHRLIAYTCPILTVPLMLAALQGRQDEQPERIQNRRTLILAVSACMLALACTRGSLCSFKFY